MTNAQRLADLASQIEKCQRCALHKTATHSVPGEGDPDTKIVFVGEAPGYFEDVQGRPFVGNAGKLLNLLIEKIGLRREEVFITNVLKHRPPENRDPEFSEIAACKYWLDSQLATLAPRLVVTLGRFSLGHFLPGKKISEVHGKPQMARGTIVIPMYHPAAALRNGAVAKTLEEDFLKNRDVFHTFEIGDNKRGEEPGGQGTLF
jgi:DNA polymerase